MKTAFIFLIGCALVAGAVIYANRERPVLVPVAATTAAAPPAAAHPAPAPMAAPPAAPAAAPATAPAAAPAPVAPAPAVKSEAEIAFGKTIDRLISTNLTGPEKHNMFEELRKNNQLDQAITELKQRAAADPTNPEIPTTLGEAQLNKLRQLRESGDTDVNDMGILAMQADQSFNAALKLDPDNWEAQFVKAASMTYWPADPARDAQVVQTLSGLIDRQETMPSQPDFAQTYIMLGNEYQKMGQTDKAIATWQLGAQKFPNDPTLKQKIDGQ